MIIGFHFIPSFWSFTLELFFFQESERKNRTYELSSEIEHQTDRRCITAIACASNTLSFVVNGYLCMFFLPDSCVLDVPYCIRFNDCRTMRGVEASTFSRDQPKK